MRIATWALLGLLAASGSFAHAQDTEKRTSARRSSDTVLVQEVGELAPALARLRENPLLPQLPAEANVTRGHLTIPSGESREGAVVVFEGTLIVRGRIVGDAIAIGGNVVLAPGGEVTGDAIAVEGNVRRDGGLLGGESRSLAGILTAVDAPVSRARRMSPVSRMGLALSWMGVLLVIGIGVLVFAQPYLEGVVDTLETRFWRSFAVGIAGAFAAVPVLALVLITLAVTIIGILLIPFAIVAYVLALAGLLTLGFVAVARLTGGVIGSDAVRRLSARGSALRGVMVGTVLLLGMWVVAAALFSVPLIGVVVRLMAGVLTFVALTAGLGATILSRVGTRGPVEAPAAAPLDPAVWQTPTPVTGVAAARRPVSRPRERV